MKKWLKWLLGLVLLLPTTALLIIALLAFLLFSNAGLNLSLWVVEKVVPEFHVGATQGSWLPAFTLHDVSYVNSELYVDTHIQQFDFAITMDCLYQHSVCVDTVALQGLKLQLTQLPPSDPDATDEQDTAISKIFIPIPVSISHLNLEDIDVNVLGNQLSWSRFSTGLYLQGNELTMRPTEWHNVNLSLADTSDAELAAPEPQVDPLPLEQRPDIQLPNIELPLGVTLEKFDLHAFTLQGDTPVIVNHLGLIASAQDSQVNITQLQLDTPDADVELQAQATLMGDYPLQLTSQLKVKREELKGQQLWLNLNGSAANLQLETQLSAGVEANIHAQVQPLKAVLPFKVQIDQGQLKWPLQGQTQYQVDLKQLSSQGSLQGYHLSLDTQLAGQEIPNVALRVNGEGDLKQITLQQIDVDTLGGNVKGQVVVNWQAPLNWQSSLQLTHIQPGLQWPQAEGDISGQLVNSGQLTAAGGWQISVPQLDIVGELRQQPIQVQGQLSAQDVQATGQVELYTQGLRVSHGHNGVKVSGSLDKDWRLDLAVDFPDFSTSLPALQGKMTGTIKLRGKQAQPDIITDLTATNIAWQHLAELKLLQLQGQISPLPAPHGDIRLHAEQGSYQQQSLDKLDISFKGDQLQHQLLLALESQMVLTNLTVSGGMSIKPQPVWHGQLEQASVTTQQGTWRLDHALKLAYILRAQQVEVGEHCWLQAAARICLTRDIKVGQSGEVWLEVEHFSLQQVAQFIPPQTQLQGEVNAKAWAKWAPKQAPQLRLDVQMPAGSVRQKLEPPVTVQWQQIKLGAVLKQNKMDLTWLLNLTDNGEISGQMSFLDVRKNSLPLKGSNQIKQIDLSFLAPLLGEDNQLQANINSQLAFSGPARHPQVQGYFNIEQIVLEGNAFPVDINPGQLLTQFSGYRAKLESNIHTQDGNLQVTGNANWADMKNWLVNLRVFGEQLAVEAPPMVKLKVKPDMAINITPHLAKIDGDISIPWGRILVESLPESAIGVSKDEIIVDDNLQPVQQQTGLPMALETNIRIHIGDDVQLSAFGLRGSLIGNLQVTQKDKGPFILGEVRIVNGYYQSFGQDLIIQEGKILMNGPADQPYVSIKAIRNPDNTEDNVVAGIRVTGPADAPEVQVFSEPAMAQTSALSYLLRGRDIDDEAGGSAMTTALIGLSLAKSGHVVGEIGKKFGVQDLQLGTAGSGDGSQVTISGYIAPGLQVKYGVGIFNALGEFTVRYELVTNLYLEAVTGIDSAVDLIYQFEFN